MKLPIATIMALAMLLPAAARDNSAAGAAGRWADSPASIRQWFQSLMQPDNPSVSCCGEADAFEADAFEAEGDHYIAIITDGKGMIPSGTRVPVPNRKMKWDAGNPTGHGVIFLRPEMVGPNQWSVYCYLPPGGV